MRFTLGNSVSNLSLTALALPLVIASSPASAEEILFSPGQTLGGDIGEFEISPDGTQVAFLGTLDNGITPGQQTYVAGILSGVANPATRVDPVGAGDNDGGVRWTPDGLSVITRYDLGGGNANELYLLPADGSASSGTAIPQQLTFNSTNAFDPRVSDDGNHLFYSDGSSLFRTPIVGASPTSSVLLNPGVTAGEISEIDTGEYAIVGSDVIFSGFITPVPGADNSTREDTFYRTAADGSTASSPTMIPITNLPTDPALNTGRFEVTSDGQSIITQGDLRDNGVTELYSIPAAGGDFVPLFDAPRADFDVNMFKLSNDGSLVAFVGDYLTNGVAEAFVVPTAGGVPIRISDSASFAGTAQDVAFTGVPDRLLFSADDQFLFYVADGGSEGNHDGTFTLHRVAVPEPMSAMSLVVVGLLNLRRSRRSSLEG